jgi:hypothetical protein
MQFSEVKENSGVGCLGTSGHRTIFPERIFVVELKTERENKSALRYAHTPKLSEININIRFNTPKLCPN